MIENSVSVVVPAFNEEECILKTLSNIHNFLIKNFNNFEIIVVDDASYDDTYSIALRLSGKIHSLKVLKNDINYGKGFSVRKGVLSAISEYILFSDADLSTPIDELNKFINYLEKGIDIVIGSRALRESNILKKQGFFRRNMGRMFNLLIQAILFGGIKDTQCGFKCLKKNVARKIFKLQRLHGFCFDAEILYIAKKCGYSIKEVPVKWINRESSRVSMIRDSFRMFLDIFQIKINDVRGCYEDR